MRCEWWIGKDVEGSDRGLILSWCRGIRLEKLGKTTKISVRIADLHVEIWTRVRVRSVNHSTTTFGLSLHECSFVGETGSKYLHWDWIRRNVWTVRHFCLYERQISSETVISVKPAITVNMARQCQHSAGSEQVGWVTDRACNRCSERNKKDVQSFCRMTETKLK
jgi:hypothetical protein